MGIEGRSRDLLGDREFGDCACSAVGIARARVFIVGQRGLFLKVLQCWNGPSNANLKFGDVNK